MSTKNNDFQWKTILGGIVLVVISMMIVAIFEFIGGKFRTDKNKVILPQPNVTVEGIQENRNKKDDRLTEIEKMNTIQLYNKPLQTPSFVSNSDKLTKYLESNTVKITIIGEVSEAYLYVKTGSIDIEKESVYFWIVNNKSDGGHLSPTENLVSKNGNEFFYDLVKLPVVQRPYSIYRSPTYIDVVNNYLNQDIGYKEEREYYVGAFVSTTQLPNQIENLEIKYSCKQGVHCSINLTK